MDLNKYIQAGLNVGDKALTGLGGIFKFFDPAELKKREEQAQRKPLSEYNPQITDLKPLASPTSVQPEQSAQLRPMQGPIANFVSPQPSDELLSQIIDAANAAGIDPAILAAVLWHESNFRPDVIAGPEDNPDVGIAQINLASHPDISREQALDPTFSVPFAANLLKSNVEHFGGDLNRAIAAYNVGKGGASVSGPNQFGGGPASQFYLDNIARNLSPEYVAKLGLKPSPNYR